MIAHRPGNYVAGLPIPIELINDQNELFDDWWWRDLGFCTIQELHTAIADQVDEDNLQGAEAGHVMLAAVAEYDKWWRRVTSDE